MKSSGRPYLFKDFKTFRLQLAKEVIGSYCSRRRRGRAGAVIHPLPFRHFSIRLGSNGEPRHPRGLVLAGTVASVKSGSAIVVTHQTIAS